MNQYRPLSPLAAWRDPRIAKLSTNARFVEINLITSTFGNVIGCYQLVEAVAAAEVGMSQEVFLEAVLELEKHMMLERCQGYYIVHRWFCNHIWESVMKGNVAKRAMKELALLPELVRQKWAEASIAAGVPFEAIDDLCKGLPSLSQGASKQLANYNDNSTQQNQTSTGSDECGSYQLILPEAMEPQRAFLERSTSELDQYRTPGS